MHGVVTSTVSFPVVSNESSKLSTEVVERLTAAGKEPFHLLDHLLSRNFCENQAVVSWNICRKITNVSSNSKYLYLPHNCKSLMQGKMHFVYAVGYSFCWCLYVRFEMLQIAGLNKMPHKLKTFIFKMKLCLLKSHPSWLSTVYPMALNPTWHVRKNSHRNRKP